MLSAARSGRESVPSRSSRDIGRRQKALHPVLEGRAPYRLWARWVYFRHAGFEQNGLVTSMCSICAIVLVDVAGSVRNGSIPDCAVGDLSISRSCLVI